MTFRAPSKLMLLFEFRALFELGTSLAAYPLLCKVPAGDGHGVMVLPGFLASDRSTRFLRDFLNNRGYDAQPWTLGRNLGNYDEILDAMTQRLNGLYQSSGRKVSLIGWSLGGVYARELARAYPEKVRLVMTLGSPFYYPTNGTNVEWLFKMISGIDPQSKVELLDTMALSPPVPSSALFSRTDGVVSHECMMEHRLDELTENIQVYGSHFGYGFNPSVLVAISDRLAQPEGEWKPFDFSGARALLFPPEGYGLTVEQE